MILDVVYLKDVVSTDYKLLIENSNILDNTETQFRLNLWLNLIDSEKKRISKNYHLISPPRLSESYFFALPSYKTKGHVS